MNVSRLNESGASLIGLMVVSAVGLTVMMGFIAFMNGQVKTIGYLEDKISRVSLENELRIHFSKSDWCKEVFKRVNLPTARSLRNITNQIGSSHSFFQHVSGGLQYDKLEVSRITVKNNDVSPSSLCGTAEVTYVVQRMREGGGPATLRPIEISLSIEGNKSLGVVTCGLQSTCTPPSEETVRWVQANLGESHAQTCSRVGMKPATNQGYGICASGERRPKKGKDYDKISYRYGTWGGGQGVGGTQVTQGLFGVGGGTAASQRGQQGQTQAIYYCYTSGQKRDNDGSDRLVAYLCSG